MKLKLSLPILLLSLFTATPTVLTCMAQEQGVDDPKRFGRFITVTSPIDDRMVSEITNLALKLESQAEREQREGVLLLEIEPGLSKFGQVRDLAKFLTSADVSRIHTVAWIPRSVDGTNAILALACHDIVMGPDASLGDFGRGQALEPDEQNFILSIVDRRRNGRLSRGVAKAMMAPNLSLMRVTVEDSTGKTEHRFLTEDEMRILQDQNVVISGTDRIKEPGSPGFFNADDAEQAGFLVSAVRKNRREVIALYKLPMEAMRDQNKGSAEVKARVIAVHDMIEPILGEFVQREMRKAIADGANLLIFDIDSPGGYLHTSEELAISISDLDPKKITTVAWIRNDAISGAAVTALGCDHIVMHPEAKIGDAGVIQETAKGGAFERAEEKIVSPFLQFMADLAHRKNRPVAVLQAMVDKDLEVFEATHTKTGQVTWMSQFELDDSNGEWVKGNVIPESRPGILLTLNGQRASELGIADAPCEDLDELRQRFGVPDDEPLVVAQRTWVDTFVWLLNTRFGGFMLITIAIICIYIELHVPTGFFGIVAAIMFSLFFWSRFLGGTAGTLELVLFVLGLVLIAMEVFVIPGFGVFGVTGILLLFASLVMASHTFAGMTAGESFEASLESLASLAGALVTVVVVALLLNQFLPSIPFLKNLILTPPGYAASASGAPFLKRSLASSPLSPDTPVQPGQIGTAASMLRPSGKGQFGVDFVDVVSDGGYIDHGSTIEVIRVAGNRIIVRALDSGGETPPVDSVG
ncbi:MAG: hypothetical protein R3C20_03070 [Planctomycetaceae bacterium]